MCEALVSTRPWAMNRNSSPNSSPTSRPAGRVPSAKARGPSLRKVTAPSTTAAMPERSAICITGVTSAAISFTAIC